MLTFESLRSGSQGFRGLQSVLAFESLRSGSQGSAGTLSERILDFPVIGFPGMVKREVREGEFEASLGSESQGKAERECRDTLLRISRD